MFLQIQAKADQGEESKLNYMSGVTSFGDMCEFFVTRDKNKNITSLKLISYFNGEPKEVIKNYSPKNKVSLGFFTTGTKVHPIHHNMIDT